MKVLPILIQNLNPVRQVFVCEQSGRILLGKGSFINAR